MWGCKQYLHVYICLMLKQTGSGSSRGHTEMHTTKTSIRRSSFLNHSQNIKTAFFYLPATVYNQLMRQWPSTTCYTGWTKTLRLFTSSLTWIQLLCAALKQSHKISDSNIVPRTKRWDRRHSEKWKLKWCLWEDAGLSAAARKRSGEGSACAAATASGWLSVGIGQGWDPCRVLHSDGPGFHGLTSQ